MDSTKLLMSLLKSVLENSELRKLGLGYRLAVTIGQRSGDEQVKLHSIIKKQVEAGVAM